MPLRAVRNAWPVVLLLGLVATGLAMWFVVSENRSRLASETQVQAKAAMSAAVERVRLYEYGLRGARGVVVAGGGAAMPRERFAAYAQSRDLQTEFPGARGFGVILRHPHGVGDEALAEYRRDGFPQFAVRELEPNPGERFVIHFIYPLAGNEGATGLDIASERSRREAALSAARNNAPRLTAPITLVQADQKRHQGFLILLPVFHLDHRRDTPEAKLASTYAWTYAPLVADEMFKELPALFPGLALSLGDREAGGFFFGRDHAVAAGAEGFPSATVEADVFGRPWVLSARANEVLSARTRIAPPAVVLGSGLLFTVLLTVIAWLSQRHEGSTRLVESGDRRFVAFLKSPLGLWSLPTLGLASLVAAWLMLIQAKTDALVQADRMLAQELQDEVDTLASALLSHRSNLEFLRHFPAMRGLVRSEKTGVDPLDGSTTEQWRSRLRLAFSSYGEAHPDVEEIRFLRAEGGGAIPVATWRRHSADAAVDEAGDTLSDEEAMLDAIGQRLLTGEVYLSPIERRSGSEGGDSPNYRLRYWFPILSEDALFGVLEFQVDVTPILSRRNDGKGDPSVVGIHILDANDRWIRGPGLPVSRAPELWKDTFKQADGAEVVSGRRIGRWNGFGAEWMGEEAGFDPNGEPDASSLRFVALMEVGAFTQASMSNWGERVKPLVVLPVGLYLMLYLLWLSQESRHAAIEQTLRLGTVLDQSQDAVVGLDNEDRIQLWSRGAESMLGVPRSEALGRSIRELLPELDGLLDRERGACHSPSVIALDRDQRRWLDVSVAMGAGGEANIGRSILLRDVSERERLQRELIELNQDLADRVEAQTAVLEDERRRLANILEGTRAGTWEWKVTTGEIRFNERWAEIVGQTLAELQPMTIRKWIELVHPDDVEAARRSLDEHFAGKSDFYASEIRLRHRSGHWVWVLIRGRVITRGVEGNPEWMFGTQLDITEAKEAALAGLRLGVTLRGVLQSATDFSIIATDVEGLITVFNAGAERMLGYSADEMVGRMTPAVIHWEPEVRERAEALSAAEGVDVSGFRTFVHVPDREGSERRQWTYVRKDGSHVPVSLTVTAIRDDADGLVGYLGIAFDITERLEGERRLRAAMRDAEAASHAKGLFLANMSHEIRTPMNAVIGISHLLEDTPLDDDQRQLLHKLRVAGRSLLGIINDVLDLAKIESGELLVEAIGFRPAEIIDEITAMFADQARAKGLGFEVLVAPDVPSHVIGDPQRVRQVLSNLVGNALKFTKTGRIEVKVAAVREESRIQCIIWSITDTGIGIPGETLARLFQPFVQAEASTTRQFGGTGLGLSIVRQLAALMGGRVEVDSKEGEGSTFRLILPLVADADSGGNVQAEFARLKVAIVVQNKALEHALVSLCTALGWQAFHFPALEELVLRESEGGRASKPPFSALLLEDRDDRFDDAKWFPLLSATLGRRLPVVLVSRSGEGGSVSSRYRGYVDAVLPWPADASMVFNAVNAACSVRSVSTAKGSGSRKDSHDREEGVPGGRELDGVRLLVVDDSDINLEVARRILERHGASVVCEMSAEAALSRIAAKEPFDAVLMDIQMPGMDGHEATRKIRSELGLDQLPVIALTAGALLEERRRAMDAGMTGFLTKPIDPEVVVRVIRSFLPQVVTPPPAPSRMLIGRPTSAGDATFSAQGVDDAAGVKRLGGDTALFWRLMSRLVEAHDEDWRSELQGRVEQGDRVWVAAALHRLRGSAALLGAVSIQALAEEGERLAKHPDAPSEACLDNVRALRAALAALDAFIPAAFTDDVGLASAVDATPASSADYRQLVDLLERQDMAAEGLIRRLGAWLLHEGLDVNAYRHVVECVENLEYARARALLLDWRKPEAREQ